MGVRTEGIRVVTAALGLSLVMLASAVGMAVADTHIADSGDIGEHKLRDSMNRPGLRCHYAQQGSRLLKWFIVRPPKLWSDDAFPSPVGWRVRVQRRGPSSSNWKTIYTSAVQHGTADEANYADFTARTISPTFANDSNPLFTDYRVLILMYQFYGDGSVAGTAKHLVDYYYDDQLGEVNGPAGACSRKTGVF